MEEKSDSSIAGLEEVEGDTVEEGRQPVQAAKG